MASKSGTANLFINGYEARPTPSCPALDPTASIQITDTLINVYQANIDALINQLGKNVYLEFDPIRDPCPNCWTSGTIIYTAQGPKQIQDIECGEYVFSSSGNVCKVIGKLQSIYEGKLFNIRCHGISLPEYITEDHELLVVKELKSMFNKKQWIDCNYTLENPKIERVKAKDIRVGDGLVIPKINNVNKDIDFLEIDGFGKIKCSDDLLEFLGWFLAEGFVHTNKRAKHIREFNFGLCASKEECVADKLIQIGKDIFDLSGKKKFIKNADTLLVSFYSSKLSKFMLKFGHLAQNKRIPYYLFQKLSNRQLGVLFNAYYLGDGTTNKRTKVCSYITTSRILAFQFYYYLVNNGFMPFIHYREGNVDKNGTNHREYWTAEWLPNRTRQRAGFKFSNVGDLSIVRKIKTKTGKEIVYNIDVDNDHSYIANSIASKNCTFDPIRKRSTGIYKEPPQFSAGPRPFKRGRKCPYCLGRGFLETAVNKCIKCLIKWNPRDVENFGISIVGRKGIVRLKTYLTEADDLMRARTIIVNKDISALMKLRVKLIQGPIPVGLREDRYCISFWELI